MKLPTLLRSSYDPNKLGLTVRGFLVGLVPLVLVLSGATGAGVDASALTQAIDAVVSALVAIATAISSIMVALGLLRKLLVRFGLIRRRGEDI